MEHNKTTAPSASGDKRNPGFAPIRRGLLEHLPEMSSNAVKLYVWLQLKAFWSGAKRGWVETSFENMERGVRWNRKMLQRTIEELEARPYIEVETAANQHELTRVKILRFDPEDRGSAEDTRVYSTISAEDIGEDTGVPSTVLSNAPGELIQNGLSVRKKSKNIRRGEEDAVRRPVNAELHHPTNRFSPLEKGEKFHARMIAKVASAHDSYRHFIRHCLESGHKHPFGDREHESFQALGYKPNLEDPLLTCGFVEAAVETYEKHKGKGLSRGILCSKVIDYCMTEQQRAKTLGDNGSEYFWPPDFQAHRDRLVQQERCGKGNGGRA